MKKMRLILKRIYLTDTYTIGMLYINFELFFETLEDKVRAFTDDDPKVYGKTAIPSGEYKIVITYSNRFKRELPLLINVPHFEGIRIHSGNTHEDTEGCILVGVNDIKGKVTKSRVTFNKLFNLMKQAEDITIEII